MSRLFRYSLLAVLFPLAGCREGPVGPKPLTILDCDSGSAYVIGRTITGSIDTDDCLDPAGDAFADYYQFEVGTAGPVSVTVSTAATSAPLVIVMFDEALEIVDIEEFEAGGDATLGAQLVPGTYFLIVAADQPGQIGPYSMTSSN